MLKIADGAEGGSKRFDWRANEATPQAPALADELWHMVTVVVNQTTKRLHVYLDGVEYPKEEPFDLNLLQAPLWDRGNDYPFTIWEDGTGKYNSGSGTRKELSGLMDDLRIYNKALSDNEVEALFIADQK